MSFTVSRYLGVATAAAALATGGALSLPVAAPEPVPADTTPGTEQAGVTAKNKFDMVRSTGAKNAGCLDGAGADVTVKELGAVEKMTVKAHDLPPETPFVLFVTQVPDAPFGIAWYQSDLESDQSGNATVSVRGRFSEETFAVANDTADAPRPHENGDFPDAAENPPFAPIHTFHLGVWFDSPADAEAAGCPATVTPFNGDHTAGIQALSTRNFVADEGPLGDLR
jgi:hypothetical protein